MSEVDGILKIGDMVSFAENDLVCVQNEKGSVMYIVLEGIFGAYIDTFTEFPLRVAEISEGGFFGEMAVIDGSPRSATVIAECNGKVLVVKREDFHLLLETDPSKARRIMKSLSGRITATRDKVRRMGKAVPEVHEKLNVSNVRGVEANLTIMKAMVKQLRTLNELIGANSKEDAVHTTEQLGLITLLPENHKRFHKTDPHDSAPLLTDREFVCPYCHATFTGKVPLFSQLLPVKRTIDQRVIYSNFDILWYRNCVCPQCNYCDSYQSFADTGNTSQRLVVRGNQFNNVEKFTGFANETRRTLDEVILSYYLSIACISKMPQSQLQLGRTWQRLYWIYSDNNERALALAAAKQARNNLDKFALNMRGRLTTVDQMTLNVMLGELSAAIGDVLQARERYADNMEIGNACKHQLIQDSAKRLKELKKFF